MNLFSGFGKRHVLIALVFCIPVQFAHLIYALLEQKHVQLSLIGVWIVFSFLFALLGLACAVASDNLLGERVGTVTRLVVALLVAAVVMTVVDWVGERPSVTTLSGEARSRSWKVVSSV